MGMAAIYDHVTLSKHPINFVTLYCLMLGSMDQCGGTNNNIRKEVYFVQLVCYNVSPQSWGKGFGKAIIFCS